ncbi:protein HEXIM1 [Aplysia californica]|uniref:Protein HEXIM1 n=1 Tax=Aplysia californica TaxID=6500 RepID=A0ABM0K880_APLCA|nr:protein HEXIM1 [Aplysia californica]
MAEVATFNEGVSSIEERNHENKLQTGGQEHPDSPDGDEYSSGSDRSYEGEDGDGGCGESSTPTKSENSRARRRRRHGSHGSRRHKGGSRHKKAFQPYPPQDEMKLKRRTLERKEKENAAAVVRREEGGQEFIRFPVAPFNSTQYLMDEHNVNSPVGLHKTPSSSKLELCSNSSPAPASVHSTPMHYSQGIMNLEKKDKEFVDIYTSVHAESLQSLPKEELVKHYMSLEEKVESLQKEMAVVKQRKLEGVKVDSREVDKDFACDSVSGSDTNSLSSSNEDFVDLSTVNQPTISVGETDTPMAETRSSAATEASKEQETS